MSRIFSIRDAEKMLPLVSRITAEIVARQATIERIKKTLQAPRTAIIQLKWPERHRHYRLAEDLETVQKELDSCIQELTELHVFLLDPARGLVGFPTFVNDRPAYLLWQLDGECCGQHAINYWRFDEDPEGTERAIPDTWRNQDQQQPILAQW